MDRDLKELKDGLDARFDRMDGKFVTLEAKIDEVRQAVGVLHEEAMSSFRFTLEALDGKEQQINARISRETAEIKSLIQPIAAAVRHFK